MTNVSRSTNNANELARQLRRFPEPHRAEVEHFAAISERLAQLALAHPVVFFALATRHGPPAARRRAVQLAEDGASLADVAATLGIPNCFRKLPPETCHTSLGPCRWSPAAERMLAPLVPDGDPITAFTWLQVAISAHRACDELFAAWAVREASARNNSFLIPALLPVAIFAWHCRHPDLPASRLIGKRWSPRLGARTALTHSLHWLRRLRTAVGLTDGGLKDPWLAGGSFGNYTFTPLMTLTDLLQEARAMINCVDTYGDLLASNFCRLFSVTCCCRRVATLELRWSHAAGSLFINDLKGPANFSCPQAVRDAAERWIALPGNRLLHPPKRARLRTLDEVLAPYREATSYGAAEWATGLTVSRLQRVVRSAASQAARASRRNRNGAAHEPGAHNSA
jgi:hypothetical protein